MQFLGKYSDMLYQSIRRALLLFIFATNSIAHQSDVKHLDLGVYPHLSQDHLERSYSSIATELTMELGIAIWFDPSDSLKDFQKKAHDQQFDIIMVHPFDYVELADKKLYQALATQTVPLKAIFVVKDSSRLQKIHNLLGRDLYFPPSSTAVSYLGKYTLKHAGINLNSDINIMFEKTHITCLQKLVIGVADSCVTAEPVMQYAEKKLGIKLRVIAESSEVPHALFAVKSTLSQEYRNKLLNTFESWNQSDKGKALLEHAMLKGLKKISDSDYDVVRKLKKEVDSY